MQEKDGGFENDDAFPENLTSTLQGSSLKVDDILKLGETENSWANPVS